MADECASVSIKYKGDGSTVLFTFPFTYMSYNDIVAFIYNEDYARWEDQENKFVFANATTVEFLTPPPAPSTDEPTYGLPGRLTLPKLRNSIRSAIRAQDLNDNFDQLRLAIQEDVVPLNRLWKKLSRCLIPYKADQEAGAWVDRG